MYFLVLLYMSIWIWPAFRVSVDHRSQTNRKLDSEACPNLASRNLKAGVWSINLDLWSVTEPVLALSLHTSSVILQPSFHIHTGHPRASRRLQAFDRLLQNANQHQTAAILCKNEIINIGSFICKDVYIPIELLISALIISITPIRPVPRCNFVYSLNP